LNLEIGLVGIGPWGANILRDLRALGAIVHAVARSPDSVARARSGGAASIVNAPGALPPNCDGYVVANRTVSHLDAVEELLPRGRPIFCEKPIGSDVARTKRLPAQAHALVFIMHKWRYQPAIVELARIASAGRYGPVQGLRTVRVGWGNPHADANVLWILTPHDLAIALALLGDVPRLVSAALDPIDPVQHGAVVHLRGRNGVPVTIEVSSGHPTPLRRVLMSCRDAVCQLDSGDYSVLAVRRHGAKESESIRVSDEMPLLAELRAFIDHLRGGPPPLTSLADEIKIIETIAAIENAILAQ
jgi:predicted dehydrogenase